VPALAVLDGQRQQPDHPGRLGGGGQQLRVELVLAAAGDGGQQVEGDAPAQGGGVDHPALGRGQVVEPAEHGLAQAPGEGEGGHLGRVGPAGGDHQLLQEERVASGAPVQGLGHLEGHRAAVDGGQQLADAGPAQALQGEGGHQALALQVGQQLDQGMAAGHGLGTEGADQQQRQVGGDGQAAEQGHALGVGRVGAGRAAQAARPAPAASASAASATAAGETRLRSAAGSTKRALRQLARNGRPRRERSATARSSSIRALASCTMMSGWAVGNMGCSLVGRSVADVAMIGS
jgi:hypothetical protein